jgi:hypothetical protein
MRKKLPREIRDMIYDYLWQNMPLEAIYAQMLHAKKLPDSPCCSWRPCVVSESHLLDPGFVDADIAAEMFEAAPVIKAPAELGWTWSRSIKDTREVFLDSDRAPKPFERWFGDLTVKIHVADLLDTWGITADRVTPAAITLQAQLIAMLADIPVHPWRALKVEVWELAGSGISLKRPLYLWLLKPAIAAVKKRGFRHVDVRHELKSRLWHNSDGKDGEGWVHISPDNKRG